MYALEEMCSSDASLLPELSKMRAACAQRSTEEAPRLELQPRSAYAARQEPALVPAPRSDGQGPLADTQSRTGERTPGETRETADLGFRIQDDLSWADQAAYGAPTSLASRLLVQRKVQLPCLGSARVDASTEQGQGTPRTPRTPRAQAGSTPTAQQVSQHLRKVGPESKRKPFAVLQQEIIGLCQESLSTAGSSNWKNPLEGGISSSSRSSHGSSGTAGAAQTGELGSVREDSVISIRIEPSPPVGRQSGARPKPPGGVLKWKGEA